MLNSIGGDLLNSLNKAGISRQIEAVQVCDLWEKVICGIFGKQVIGQSQALHFKNGTLTVAVLSPVLAQEFKFKEEEIKKEINAGRKDKVRKIRFEI
ncbi:MAG: DciA family protein [Patescibacteria group bacterium]